MPLFSASLNQLKGASLLLRTTKSAARKLLDSLVNARSMRSASNDTEVTTATANTSDQRIRPKSPPRHVLISIFKERTSLIPDQY